jgi:hypothetical protein
VGDGEGVAANAEVGTREKRIARIKEVTPLPDPWVSMIKLYLNPPDIYQNSRDKYSY